MRAVRTSVIAGLVCVVVSGSCTNSPDDTQPVDTTISSRPATTITTTTITTTTITTTTITTTVATTIPSDIEAAPLPRSLCCDGVDVPAGTYRLPNFWKTPLDVDVGDGWRAVFDVTVALVAFVQGQNAVQDPSRWLYVIRAPAGLTPGDVVGAMVASDELLDATTPTPVAIAGYSGLQFDATAAIDPDQVAVAANGIEAGAIQLDALTNTGYFPDGFLAGSATAGSQLRFIALDIGERTMLALIDAPADEFARFADEAIALLSSMRPAPPE